MQRWTTAEPLVLLAPSAVVLFVAVPLGLVALNWLRLYLPLVAARLGWSYTRIGNPRVELLAAGAAPGFESATAPGWVAGAYVSGVATGAVWPGIH